MRKTQHSHLLYIGQATELKQIENQVTFGLWSLNRARCELETAAKEAIDEAESLASIDLIRRKLDSRILSARVIRQLTARCNARARQLRQLGRAAG